VHRPEPWATSTRKARLPSNWAKLAAFVLARDRCICYLCGAGGCRRVDHIIRGDNHDPSNLAAICAKCDKHKSAVEGGTLQRRYTP
jgi:5-methylcytosine-specific restriction enzyme A